MNAGNFDGNAFLDGFIFLASVVLGVVFLWEAAAMLTAHLTTGPTSIWRVTLTELVMRYPVLGLAIVVLCTFTIGWLTGHWVDSLRMRA